MGSYFLLFYFLTKFKFLAKWREKGKKRQASYLVELHFVPVCDSNNSNVYPSLEHVRHTTPL